MPENTRPPAPEHAVWRVAPDGGRPEGRRCAHTGAVPPPLPHPGECEDCAPGAPGRVRLRRCTSCGHVGCCDSSRGRHAYAHFEETGHPVAVSLASDEAWAWCYADEVFLVRDGG
ncbi:UBP-type zinc finger domain-containing protein [Streptomyces zhihengii]|uniref:UBP-type zinc finger domain-containing protein n=1 Tax=Streptomyces zhihengii TaxID=1818004 RepID=UPI00345642A7